jgi:BON domain
MRSPKLSGAALLAFGAGAALWLWRNPQVRSTAQQALDYARLRLGESRISERLSRWLPVSLAGTDPALGPQRVPGVLSQDDQNLTITQRVRSNLGREPAVASVPHFNINTEGDGVVYLRGYVYTEEQRRAAEMVTSTTEGVTQVVNELHIEQAVNL